MPNSIAVEHLIPVHDDAHTRFDASLRAYEYHLIARRDPFRQYTTYFLPTLKQIGF